MVTVPVETLKMRKSGVPMAELRWITRLLAPGPAMIRSLSIRSSPLVSVMVLTLEKLIVSPEAALAMASRNEPGPSSAVVVTVAARPGSQSSSEVRVKKVIMQPLGFRQDESVLFIGNAANSSMYARITNARDRALGDVIRRSGGD